MKKEMMNTKKQAGILNKIATLLKEAEGGGFELPPIDGETIDALQGVVVASYSYGDVFPAMCRDSLAGRFPVEAYGVGRGRFGMVTEPHILSMAFEEAAFLIGTSSIRLKERTYKALCSFICKCHRMKKGD